MSLYSCGGFLHTCGKKELKAAASTHSTHIANTRLLIRVCISLYLAHPAAAAGRLVLTGLSAGVPRQSTVDGSIAGGTAGACRRAARAAARVGCGARPRVGSTSASYSSCVQSANLLTPSLRRWKKKKINISVIIRPELC